MSCVYIYIYIYIYGHVEARTIVSPGRRLIVGNSLEKTSLQQLSDSSITQLQNDPYQQGLGFRV